MVSKGETLLEPATSALQSEGEENYGKLHEPYRTGLVSVVEERVTPLRDPENGGELQSDGKVVFLPQVSSQASRMTTPALETRT